MGKWMLRVHQVALLAAFQLKQIKHDSMCSFVLEILIGVKTSNCNFPFRFTKSRLKNFTKESGSHSKQVMFSWSSSELIHLLDCTSTPAQVCSVFFTLYCTSNCLMYSSQKINPSYTCLLREPEITSLVKGRRTTAK